MCPGGIIAPASTNANELVVNGWSPSKRNNPYANSGMVTETGEKDIQDFMKKQPALLNKEMNILAGNNYYPGCIFSKWWNKKRIPRAGANLWPGPAHERFCEWLKHPLLCRLFLFTRYPFN